MTATRTPSLAGPAVRALAVVVVLVGVGFTASTLPGARDAHPGFWVPVDGWFQGTGYALMAVLIVLRPVLRREARVLWTLLAAAVTLRVLGYLLYFAWVRTLVPPPYPSVSDPLWLGASLLFIAAIARRAGYRRRGLSLLLVLDGLVTALTVAGVAVALLAGTVARLTAPGVPSSAVTLNVAYPALDVVALVLIAGLLGSGWRPDRAERLVAAGIVLYSVVETVYLYRLAAGTFRPGTLLSSLSYVATVLVVLAAWVRVDLPARTDGVAPPELPPRPGVVVPVLLGTACLASLLAMAYSGDVSRPAVALLVLALGVVLLRGVVTLGRDRDEAVSVIASRDRELARLQDLVEASGDFVLVATLEGRVVSVNPAGRRLVGLEPDRDPATTSYDDYLTPEGRRRLEEVERPAVLAEGHWEGRSTLRDGRGGPPIPVTVSSFLLRHPQTHEPFALATVQRDISALVAAQDATARLAEQRQLLLERLVQAQEDERSRIAADVHDDSVQALAAVDLRLELVSRRLVDAEPALLETIDRAHESVVDATARLRSLLFDLESPALHTDLATALREAAAYVLEDTDVRWRLTGDATPDLPRAQRVTAYRVVKEALGNVRAHAGAGCVEISLEERDDGVLVVVRDDGRGVDLSSLRERPGHLGLTNMRDRATVAGGWVRLESAPGEGTAVHLWVPREPVA